MSPQDLTPYERAARIYCQRMDIGADDNVQATGTTVCTAENIRPRWMNVAEQMVHLSLMMVSMREAISFDVPVAMNQ